MSFAIVKVKPGVTLSVDRHQERIDDNGLWLAEKVRGYIKLTRPGYGSKSDYGCGAAMTRRVDCLELATPWCLIDSPLLDSCRHWKF